MPTIFRRSQASAAAPAIPDFSATTSTLDQRATDLGARIERMEADVRRLKAEMATATPAKKQMLTQRALMILRQKKTLEQQYETITNQSFTLGQVAFQIEQVQANVQTVAAMQQATEALRAASRDFTPDHIAQIQEEMADALLDQQEISEILSQSFTVDSSVDDASLEAEWNRLVGESTESALPAIPASTATPSYLQAAVEPSPQAMPM
jgi:hypothetical protein